jgi:serine/threonine-protein kinase
MGGRFVAIKVLQEFDDQELRARFEREADIAGTLDHRNIVQIYDRAECDGGRLSSWSASTDARGWLGFERAF